MSIQKPQNENEQQNQFQLTKINSYKIKMFPKMLLTFYQVQFKPCKCNQNLNRFSKSSIKQI